MVSKTSSSDVSAPTLSREPISDEDLLRGFLLALGATESEVLFTLMAERYERRAMGITSNLVFSQWDQVFQNPMATAAAIDRVVHHAVILEFDVPSFRTGQAQEHLREEADDNYRQGVQRQK